MRESIKSYLPARLVRALRDRRDAWQRAREWPAARLHPWRRESLRRLTTLRDSRRGERCFIIGNGPSLKLIDLARLRGEFTFGMNRVYLAFPEWGFQTSCLVSVNSLVIEQCAAELRGLDLPKFFSWRSRDLLYPPGGEVPDRHTHFLHTTYTGPRFAKDVRGRLWEGATVTYVCLQLAFHLGFQTAILIGVDHSFSTQGIPNTTIVSQGDDPNHFAPEYFGKGFRWQLPDLDTSEAGYRLARRAYEQAGRRIVDATAGGQLNVFEKVNYKTLFD